MRGQIVSAIAEADFGIPLPFFCKKYFSYIILSQRKKLGFEMSFYPPEIGLTYGGDSPYPGIAVLKPRLRCPCQDCSAHAKIEVLMLRLRCSSHLNLGLSTAISA